MDGALAPGPRTREESLPPHPHPLQPHPPLNHEAAEGGERGSEGAWEWPSKPPRALRPSNALEVEQHAGRLAPLTVTTSRVSTSLSALPPTTPLAPMHFTPAPDATRSALASPPNPKAVYSAPLPHDWPGERNAQGGPPMRAF